MAAFPIPRGEEFANALTHGLGAAASLLAGIALVAVAVLGGDGWRIASAAVYSLTLLLLYSASTAYHSAPHGPLKDRLEILDHCAIFLLIAGTYTPFTLISLRGPWGWTLFGIVWGLAVAGVAIKLIIATRFDLLSTICYLAMGWIVVIAIEPMIQALSATTLAWLVAGGVAYTLGTIFYRRKHVPYSHAVWHLFVLAGSLCHFIAVGAVVMV
ncbi:MAG: PAQR family membrane homeostasis protein TrhA [Oscillochloridaceae bacterium umkhey_bin13]